jgi:hypothetical protein
MARKTKKCPYFNSRVRGEVYQDGSDRGGEGVRFGKGDEILD